MTAGLPDICMPATTAQGKQTSSPKKSAGKTPAKRKNRRHTGIFILAGVAIILLIALAFSLPLLLSKSSQDAVIRIPANASVSTIKDSLTRYLGEEYASKVMRVASLRSSDFSNRHGAYLIPAGTSPLRAERKLSQGAQMPLTITINGFRTLPLLAERISRRLDFPADSLLSALSDSYTMAKYGLTPQQALSLFIDDSYELYWSATPAEVIKKIGDNYTKVWNPRRTEKASALGLSPAEIMTVCSIVDEETNKKDEKGNIGRLYINRLNIGMPLQADPTVKYATGDFSIRRITGQHLKTDSPYNTYKHRGLPPGPIRTTSTATIDAVLDSSPSGYLYMCAKEDFSGYHNFASTFQEHSANARRYRQALDKRGIK